MGWKDLIGPVTSVALGTRVGDAADSLFNAPSNKFKKQYEMQKEFAQNALQWRVKDAEAAGLHPLAALGMPLASYSPVSVGEGGNAQDAFSAMGQDIGRAMTAMDSPDMKANAQFQALQLENMGLQNDKLRAEIALATQPGSPPGAPFGQAPVSGAYISPSQPNKNKYYQDHYGEGADVITYPDMVYDIGRMPGGIFDPSVSENIVSPAVDAAFKEAIAKGISTLRQWYTPGGWNEYWR